MSGGEREGVVEVLEWRGERICVGGGGGVSEGARALGWVRWCK